MKSNPNILVHVLCLMILTLLASGCKKAEDTVSPVTLNEIEDYGYKYALCTGTFLHNNDPFLELIGLCLSTVTNEPTLANSNHPRISPRGDGYIHILNDTMGQADFECNLIELEPNTTYFIRCAYAKNITDTLYSNTVSITTKFFEITSIEFNDEVTYGQINDIDNNTYKTVEIGPQTWMAENLKTTKFNDGTSIPLIDNISDFLATTNPAYCNFENNEVAAGPLGKLYNWYVVDQENVCPSGWHVATAIDWDELDHYLLDHYLCNGKALASKSGWMEAFWFDCNIGCDLTSNDSTGFSAIAAGAFSDNEFGGFGHAGVWWSPDDYTGGYLPSSRYLTKETSYLGVNSTEAENKGYSIRCIKD